MSVRRLAEDSVQPADFAFMGENIGWAQLTIRKYPEGRQQSAVIPLLMRAQEQDGWVTKAAIEHVAGMLKMPLIRVLEVATFYTQFQLKPVGTKAHIQVCGTTPCMLRGSDELKRVCQSRIHHDQFHLNASGTLSWEEVECLGACVNAPMAMVFKDTYEDLTPERLEEIIDAFERGEDVKAGPQIDRQLSAPFGGPTTLMAADPRSDVETETSGASEQGSGAGAAGAESQAGRPTTHAAETDPSIHAPAGAAASSRAAAADSAASIDASSGAGMPGAGAEGGTMRGATGAGDKEAAADAAASARTRESADGQVSLDAARTSEDSVAAPSVIGQPAALAAAIVTEAAAVDESGQRIVGEKPAGLLSIPDGEKDDLQIIKGIGPVIEAKLHDLGIFHFRQIAAWTTKELVWIDDYLNFRGRAVRENWVRQAGDLDAKRLGSM